VVTPDLARAGGLGARPAATTRLVNHGFVAGQFVPPVNAGAPYDELIAAGIDHYNIRETGEYKYNTRVMPQNPAPVGAPRQVSYLTAAFPGTSLSGAVRVSDSATADFGRDNGNTGVRFGSFAHIQDQIGNSKQLDDFRQAAARLGLPEPQVRCWAIRLTPDAVVAATLPHHFDDIWAAYYLALAGPNANRASIDADVSQHLFAVILPGPDAYTCDSIFTHDPCTVANGGHRLMFKDESQGG